MAALGGSSLNAAAAAGGGGGAVSGGGGGGGGVGVGVGGSPGAAINAARASPMPDLSHLTEEERRIIEQVLLRQRLEEEQETEIVR